MVFSSSPDNCIWIFKWHLDKITKGHFLQNKDDGSIIWKWYLNFYILGKQRYEILINYDFDIPCKTLPR